MTTLNFHERNANTRAICEPRWVGWEYPKSKNDPCGGCPLFTPCVRQCPAPATLVHHNEWIDGINELADALSKE